ncbi:hypothetical protein ACFQYP_56575 [Nonomuraea antimicrobica]
MAGVVSAVEGELAQRGELCLDPVQVGGVGGRVGDPDVVRLRPLADSLVLLGGQVWAEVAADDGDPHLGLRFLICPYTLSVAQV